MKYKVGDKVRVREDLIVGKEYGAQVFANGMMELRGKIVTIKCVTNGHLHARCEHCNIAICQ